MFGLVVVSYFVKVYQQKATMNQDDDISDKKIQFDHLSDEVWMQILSFVPPLEILLSVTNVSKSLHAVAHPESYWLFHVKSLLQTIHHQNSMANIAISWLDNVELNRHQLQRLCVFLAARCGACSSLDDDGLEVQQLPACLLYGSRLVNRVGAESIRQHIYRNSYIFTNSHRRRVCLATSTEHPTELLENVLGSLGTNSADEILQNLGVFALRQHAFQKWWSSKPSPTQESSDTILFTTNCPLALLSDLKWRPLLDPFTRSQAYTWKHAIVKAYRLPLSKLDPHPDQARAGFPCTVAALPRGVQRRPASDAADDMSIDSDDDIDLSLQSAQQEREALDRLLEGEHPVFESAPLAYAPMRGDESTLPRLQRSIPWQHVIFPPALLANVITITLVGKNSRQFQHSGFYACVEQVKLEGIPLLKGVYETEFAERSSYGFSRPFEPLRRPEE